MAVNYDELLSDQTPGVGLQPPAESAPNKYDQILDSDATLQKDNLKQSMFVATQRNPDEHAKAMDLSQKTGVPTSLIDDTTKDLVKQKAADGAVDYDSLIKQSPKLSKWLENPDNASVAHDDLSNATTHEGLIDNAKVANSFLDALKAGWQSSSSVMLARQKNADQQLPPDAPIWNRLGMQAAELAGDFPEMVAGGIAGGIVGAPIGGALGSAIGPVGTLGGIATGIAGGSTAGAFALPGAMKEALRLHFERGDIHDIPDLIERTKLIMKEAAKQSAVGLVTAASGGLANKFIGGTIAPLAAEVVGMTTAGKAVEGETPKWQDYLEGAILVGGLHGATHLVGKAINHYIDLNKAEQNKEFIEGVANAATDSKLRARSPETYGQMLGELSKEGHAEHVYISPQALTEYFQGQKVDPDVAVAELGATDSYNEAKQTGADVKIPFSTFVNKLADTEHVKGLANDIKFQPGEMSFNELKAEQDVAKEQLTQTDQAANEQDKELGVDYQESAAKVADNVKAQLLATGLDDKTAGTYAKIYESTFRALGERTSQDPQALYDSYQLKIGGGERGVGGEGTILNQKPIDYGLIQSLGYSDEINYEDFGDASDHFNLMANRTMESYGEPIDNGISIKSPEDLIPKSAIKDKAGWLKNIPQEKWAEAFNEKHGRNISKILEAKAAGELAPAITINGSLADGYARAHLAHALGEKIPVAEYSAKRIFNQDAISSDGKPPFYITKDGETFHSIEELHDHELHTDQISGIKNLKAFDRDASKGWPTVTAIDMDGLTKLNADLGHLGTNKVMRLLGSFLKEVEAQNPDVSFYHRHGDEFAARFKDSGAADRVMKEIQDILDNAKYEVDADGKRHTRNGIGISYGNHETYEQADKEAYKNKEQRFAEGKREPKEFTGQSRRFVSVEDIRPDQVSDTARFVRPDQGGVQTRGQTTLDQSPLGFYSQLESEIAKMDFNNIPAKDLAGRIKNIPGIKQEELEFTGFGDWLKAKDGKVSKEEVLQFIKDNGVKVEQVVKSKDFGGDKVGDTHWGEPERVDLDDHYQLQSNIESEMDYYISQPEDAFSKEELATWKSEAEKDHTDEDGNVDQHAADEAYDEKIREEAEKRAEESVQSEDYPGARYKVELGDTGHTLEGSDEYGWGAEVTENGRTKWKNYGSNLNEAQIQYMSDLIDSGEIEGKISDAIKPKDIEWHDPHRALDYTKLKTATTKLFNKDKEAYLKRAASEVENDEYYKDQSEKDKKAHIDYTAREFAIEDAKAQLTDVNNKKRNVVFKMDAPMHEGHIEGNNIKGYTFTLNDEKIPLEAKDPEAAKAEAVQKLIEKGLISKADERPEGSDHNTPTGTTEWDQYKLPGAENYREVLLTVPNVGPEKFHYPTHRWEERNILAHVRLSDRVDAKGRKTLFIEELQSDWHQQGREKGYATPEYRAERKAAKEEYEKLSEAKDQAKKETDTVWESLKDRLHEVTGIRATGSLESVVIRQWKDSPTVEQDRAKERIGEKIYNKIVNDSEIEALRNKYFEANEKTNKATNARDEARNKIGFNDAIPDAPFKNTDAWTALALKRMIRMAVEQGYEALSWTPADVHVDRWGTDSVSWVKKPAVFDYMLNGDTVSPEFKTKEEAQAWLNKKVLSDKQKAAFELQETKPGWLVGSAEQSGGNADGVNIEALARARGQLLERNGERVTNKEELRNVIADTLGREKNDRSLDALTDRAWKQMQAEDQHTGAIKPRQEGMEFFYNKMIPDVAKKILKKLDPEAKIEPTHFSTNERLADGGGQAALEIPITDAMKEKVKEGFTLFQPGDQGPRGQIRFGSDRKFRIDFLKNADLSTFLHETGHFYMEVLGDLAQQENVPQQIKDDYATVLKWFGVESRDQIKNEHHEQWARGFESFFMTGKAPTNALRKVFARIKVWLLSVYKNVKALNVELSPQIASVMARLMATDYEIKAAEHSQKMEPLFKDPEAFGLTGDKATRYKQAIEDARQNAEEQVTAKLMQDLRRQESESYKEKRKGVEKEVHEELSQAREYKALEALQSKDGIDGNPPLKISKSSLEDIGAENMPKGISHKDGTHVEIVAQLLNFLDGNDLVKSLSGIAKLKDAVKAETDKRMAEYYPDSLTDGTISEAAIKATHNDKRAEIMRMELEHLASEHMPVLKDMIKQTARRVPSEAAVREQATKIVSSKTVAEVKPHVYQRAEIKAANEAGVALTRGDFQAAFEAKRKELLNHELYRAAVDAEEYIDKQVRKFKKLARADEDIAKTRDVDLVNAARAILAQFGLGKKDKPAASYLEQMKRYDPDTYNNVMAQIESATERVDNYKNISYDDFVAMSDAVHAIYDLAKTSREIEIDGKKMDREQIKDELHARLSEIAKPGVKPGYAQAVTEGEKFTMKLLSAAASLKLVEHWADTMDGLEKGPFRKYIWNPVSEGVTKYRLAKHEVIKNYEKIVKEIAPSLSRKPIDAPEIGYKFKDKTELLMAVLHSGNESNLDKLLRGRQWGTIDANGAVDKSRWEQFIARAHKDGILTKVDYDFAQKVWDLMESLKPDAQRAHKQMYGHYFNEITAEPIQTPFGEYRGGYVPAKVEVYTNEDSAIRHEREEFEKNNNSYQFPTAGRGFSKSRVQQYAAPLSLELSLLGGHIDNVLRFTHIEPRVKEVARIVVDKGFRSNLATVDSAAGKDLLMPWLQRSAQQKVVLPSESGIGRMMDSAAKVLRKNVAMQIMVGNVTNTIQQFTGLVVAMAKVPPSHIRGALVDYIRDTKGVTDAMLEKSDFMRSTQGSNIYETQEAIHQILVNPSTFEKAQDFAKRHTYFLQSATQNIVNTITWNGAYNHAIEKGETEIEAVRSADSATRLTQGTNNPEDISRFQTGTATARLFNQFAGYFNMLANLNAGEMTKTVRELGLKKGAGRMLYVYATAFMIPAVLSQALTQAMSGKGLDANDDDSYLDDMLSIFFGSQFNTLTAATPYVGPIVNAVVNNFNNNRSDDRLNISPVISTIEGMAGTASEVYKNIDGDLDNKKRVTKDVLTLMGVMSGLPLGPAGRPVGYLMDVNDGNANPSGPIDFTRGLVTGQKGQQ